MRWGVKSRIALGFAAVAMLSTALWTLSPLFPWVALLLAITMLPLGCAALIVTVLTELRNKTKRGSETRHTIKHKGQPRRASN